MDAIAVTAVTAITRCPGITATTASTPIPSPIARRGIPACSASATDTTGAGIPAATTNTTPASPLSASPPGTTDTTADEQLRAFGWARVIF